MSSLNSKKEQGSEKSTLDERMALAAGVSEHAGGIARQRGGRGEAGDFVSGDSGCSGGDRSVGDDNQESACESGGVVAGQI